MIRYIQKIVLLLLVFISQFTYAQVYPVQVVPVVLSPYSSKLSDYANPMVNRINLQLITTDLLVTNRPALLSLKIQGNGMTAQSAPVLSSINPVYLNGGEILSLTSADIAGYFRYQNLQGLTTTRYSEPLPDGVYTICFQVYDMMTKKWLSQNSCATVYLMLNDPPQLNLPSNNEQIPSTDFPNIVFSWTPRHMNATNVSYEFELKEILNTSLDPAFAFEVSPLLLKEENLRTTTLLYDVSKPTLIPGKTYAWRVKAVSTNGLAENSVFKNNGYSQVHSFKYTANCDAPRFLMSEQQSRSGVKLMWQGENSHKKYHVQYRKANVENAQWFEVYTINTQTLLQGLEPGFTYEFRVGASCEMEQYGMPQSFVYSGIQTFTINKEENSTSYNCGIVPKIEITNQQPLNTLNVNETFMAGDFPVKVLDVTGAGGTFSGSGYIQVPYLFDTRIAVEFKNIRINTDYQMVDGVVETAYDPDWSNVDYVDNLWDVNQQSETVDFPIDTIEVHNGEIVVTGPNGQTETFPGGKDTVITDSTGNSYYVDANGNVSGPHKQADGGKPTPENTDGVDKKGEVTTLTAEGVRVDFEQHTTSKYAYDKVAYNKALTKEYKEVDGKFVSFKAVANGHEEFFVAKVNITDTKVNADSLFFKTQNGVKVDAVRMQNSNDYVLTLKGAQKFAVEEVQATIKQGDKYKIAGVFNLVHVSSRTVKLKLVPTASNMNVADKVAEIKAIYNQLALNVDIEVVESFDISSHLVNGKVPTEDEFGDLTTYSPAQKAIISAFTKERTPEQAYYIFVTNAASSTGQGGYMALGNQFGFVFDQSARTMAHEFGHGALGLEHPFKEYKNKGLNKGKTQSVMDYAQGTDLLFTDWKRINDPKFRLYAFQNQDEGQHIDGDFELTEDGYFMTPSNKIFRLPKGSKVNFYKVLSPQKVVNGAIYGFTLPDGKSYQVKFDQFIYIIQFGSTKFSGYFQETGSTLGQQYIDQNNYKVGKQPVYLIQLVHEETINDEIHYKYSIVKAEIEITNANIKSSANFANDPFIGDLTPHKNPVVVKQITQVLNYKGAIEQVAKIESGKNKNTILTVFFNKETKKYSVEVELKGKAANSEVSSQKEALKAQIKKLAEEKLNQLGGLDGTVEKGFVEKTEDGGEFYVKDMNGREWLTTIGDLGESVWENASMPKSYWNKDEGYNNATIHVPPTFAGVGDGVIEEVTNYPQLVKLAYDVSTKKEVRTGLWESVKGISVETIKDAAVDFYEEKKANYTSDKSYIVQHTVSKDAVQVASIIFGGGGIKAVTKNVDEGVENVGKKIKKSIDDKKVNLDEFMSSADFANLMDNSFKKYKGQLNRADWEARYKTLYKNRNIGKLTEEQFLILEGGFKPKKAITTSDGKRYFDNVLDETAREVKSGPVTLSKYKEQILKDIEILNQNLTNNQISKIE